MSVPGATCCKSLIQKLKARVVQFCVSSRDIANDNFGRGGGSREGSAPLAPFRPISRRARVPPLGTTLHAVRGVTQVPNAVPEFFQGRVSGRLASLLRHGQDACSPAG
jgi:hypothetical protein